MGRIMALFTQLTRVAYGAGHDLDDLLTRPGPDLCRDYGDLVIGVLGPQVLKAVLGPEHLRQAEIEKNLNKRHVGPEQEGALKAGIAEKQGREVKG